MSGVDRNRPKNLVVRLHDLFCSIKLSIFVLIALAATSIFGTIIQQGRESEVYIQEDGYAIARIIEALNLNNMYQSWWFQILLILLLVNIAFCSIKRLPHAIRLMRENEPQFDGRPVAIHERWEKRIKGGSLGDLSALVERVLSNRVASPSRREVDGKIYYFSSRGRWSRLGVYVTHSSLFLFAVGALIGAEFGFKGYAQIPEGGSVSQIVTRAGSAMDLGFGVRCNSFHLQYYPDGRVREYLSDLTVIQSGKEVLRKIIEVNSPLIYNGIFFYQSSYGAAGAWLTVFGPRSNIVAYKKYLPQRGRIDLERGEQIVLWELPTLGGRPAAQLVLFRQGKEPIATVVLPGNRRSLGKYEVQVEQLKMYTGLQVAKDPGVPLIWAGCVLISIGTLVAFFASHKRIWARLQADASGVTVFLGGNASRNRVSFERWFAELCEYVQESFEKETPN